MNLIEQLGGYEATKEKYKALSDSDMITIGPIEFSAKPYFKDELLEYRRQHNIFEVGDKVVYVDDFMPDSVSVVSEVNDRVWLNGNNAVCIEEMIKHATDEEIQAGKRLEVK